MAMKNYAIRYSNGTAMTNPYQITTHNAGKILALAAKAAKTRNPYIKFRINSHTDDGFAQQLDDKHTLATIGIKSLYNNTANGCVSSKNLAFCIKNVFYEECHHMLFTTDYRTQPIDAQTRRMLLDVKLSNVFPEYYQAHYFDIPHEVTAEKYGIEKARLFAKENKSLFKNMDFEHSLTEYINTYKVWYGETPVKSLDEALEKLNDKLEMMKDPKTLPPIKGLSGLRCNEDSWMPDLAKDPKFKRCLDTAKTLFDQQLVLIDYIDSRDKEYFKDCMNILPDERKHLAKHAYALSPTAPRHYDRTIVLPDSLREQPDTQQADLPDYS